jgi:hypothetical protein
MPSVLDRIFGRKPKAEEEPLLKEGTMQQVSVEAIKQPEVIEHGIPVEIPVKVEETKKEDFDA